MSLFGQYDDDNVFAKILRGELPCVRVFEDDVALAFMDLFPQARGHTLVVPKGVRARTLLDFPPDQLAPYFERVQRIARAVAHGLIADGLTIMQFNGAPGGQTVFHLHVHIIPRKEGVPLAGHGSGKKADIAELEAVAAQIAAALT
jgi:histidine triad (HIT) family protein